MHFQLAVKVNVVQVSRHMQTDYSRTPRFQLTDCTDIYADTGYSSIDCTHESVFAVTTDSYFLIKHRVLNHNQLFLFENPNTTVAAKKEKKGSVQSAILK